MYRFIDPGRILETTRRLERRIKERFPEANLTQVAGELNGLAEQAQERCLALRKPNVGFRIIGILLTLLGLAGLTLLLSKVQWSREGWLVENFFEEFDAATGTLLILGAAVFSAVTLENRVKRRRALRAVHELRAMAHIIDLHQLTKDPERILDVAEDFDGPPDHPWTAFELGRYFDYCSEMLSLLSKIAVLYVQDFTDPVVLSAVDEVENLTTGLSRKIWQKITLIDRYDGGGPPRPAV